MRNAGIGRSSPNSLQFIEPRGCCAATNAACSASMHADIVLATFNARYTHASLGLRSLRANLGPYRERSTIVEATLTTKTWTLVERILALQPKVVGVGVYVWNAKESLQLVRMLKALAPDLVVVVGGPEVSHEVEQQEICCRADFVVRGEGETAFLRLCEHVLVGRTLAVVPPKVIDGSTPPLGELRLPVDEYSDQDLRERTVYVEASRGCPFRCSFCLSALDRGVRAFPMAILLDALGRLHDRGLRRFKFVDRTFNLAVADAQQILEFFLDRGAEDLFLHFEMIPDRLPAPLLETLARFPAGAVQLEVGFQTFDAEVARRIQRRTNLPVALQHLEQLRARTGVHVHADLIAGLPGETWETFASGFNQLVEAQPQEIQLGVLKRLRGAPMAGSADVAEFVFDDEPPYEVLQTPTLSFGELAELRRIAWVWDRVFNQGRAPRAAALLREVWSTEGSVFRGLARLTQEIAAAEPALHGVAWTRLLGHVHRHLLRAGVPVPQALEVAQHDAKHAKIGAFVPLAVGQPAERTRPTGPPPRQRRHLGTEVASS